MLLSLLSCCFSCHLLHFRGPLGAQASERRVACVRSLACLRACMLACAPASLISCFHAAIFPRLLSSFLARVVACSLSRLLSFLLACSLACLLVCMFSFRAFLVSLQCLASCFDVLNTECASLSLPLCVSMSQHLRRCVSVSLFCVFASLCLFVSASLYRLVSVSWCFCVFVSLSLCASTAHMPRDTLHRISSCMCVAWYPLRRWTRQARARRCVKLAQTIQTGSAKCSSWPTQEEGSLSGLVAWSKPPARIRTSSRCRLSGRGPEATVPTRHPTHWSGRMWSQKV